jgi:putative nucleotidyltransferase-like protein
MPARNPSFDEIESTFKRAVASLRRADVPFAVAGGLATWARGGPESSRDIDVVVKPEDAERALDALVEAGLRAEEPPEEWLYKAFSDDDVMVDVIFGPKGVTVDDDMLARADPIEAFGVTAPIMALDDVLASKLLALHEHYLDYESPLQIARSLREQIDWDALRARTCHSAYAKAFFVLVDELGLTATEGPRDITSERSDRQVPAS